MPICTLQLVHLSISLLDHVLHPLTAFHMKIYRPCVCMWDILPLGLEAFVFQGSWRATTLSGKAHLHISKILPVFLSVGIQIFQAEECGQVIRFSLRRVEMQLEMSMWEKTSAKSVDWYLRFAYCMKFTTESLWDHEKWTKLELISIYYISVVPWNLLRHVRVASWFAIGLFLVWLLLQQGETVRSLVVMQSVQVKSNVKHYVFASQLDSSTRGH